MRGETLKEHFAIHSYVF